MWDYREFEAKHDELGTSLCERSAIWWDHLADCEIESLQWDEWAKASPDVVHNRARIYRRTAEALRIEERTGVPVCVCCHQPRGKCLRDKVRRN